MNESKGTGPLMKLGIILAAVIIILRIILEQAGAPEIANNIFGVAWLYFIFPVLFAVRIGKDQATGRVKALLNNVVLFALYTRLMVMVSYMAAYAFQWRAPRFSAAMGGNVGPDVGPLSGVLIIPVRNALIWVVGATIIGMIIGGITLMLRRKPLPA